MLNISLTIALIGAVMSQLQVSQPTTPKMALDLNVECVSLLGENLYRKPAEGAELKRLEARLAEAQKNADAQPENPAAHIARGQALAALWRYHDAAQAYTKVIALNPADATGYVLRGNAFTVLRLFTQAAADLEHATAIDPGSYEAWYGLGLTNWLAGKFDKAATAFGKAFNLAGDQQREADAGELNNIAAARAGKEDLKVVLGGAVAKRSADDPFTAYLEGLNKRVNDEAGAMADWRKLAASPNWPSLGVIAAEAEIAAVEGSKKMRNTRY